MNIDRNIVARALDKAGEEPLTNSEWEEKNGTRFRLISDFYHATILETLANTDWTSQKKRVRLELSEEENLTNMLYMYNVPIDCAKPVQLNDDSIFVCEDGYIYTNTQDAILVYISDGYDGVDRPDDDYNYYRDYDFDPLLSEYIETRLASKIVFKITGDLNKYNTLYNESLLMENRAVKASSAHGRNKDQGSDMWSDILGLPDYKELY